MKHMLGWSLDQWVVQTELSRMMAKNMAIMNRCVHGWLQRDYFKAFSKWKHVSLRREG